MPKELREAHQESDRTVMVAYGFHTRMTDTECFAKSMKIDKEKFDEILSSLNN